MAKFYGQIGFAIPTEIEKGIWEDTITEKKYSGDILRNNILYNSAQSINENISMNNLISIVADPYANNNYYAMRYIRYRNGVWKITNVELQYPRLILTIGGVYNGKQA